jgi:hypothetical protein
MLDVDWASLFKSFYEKVRIKIACRDPSKILQERLFELAQKLYLVTILVEGLEAEQNVDDPDDQGGDDGDDKRDNGDKDNRDDGYDGLDDSGFNGNRSTKVPGRR